MQMVAAGGGKDSNTHEMKVDTRFCEVSLDTSEKINWDSLFDMISIYVFFVFCFNYNKQSHNTTSF